MRFISLAELRGMPPGTIYQEYTSRNGLSEPQVFGEAFSPNDYTEADLLPRWGFTSCFGGYEAAILNKLGVAQSVMAVWYPSGFGRNGYYEKEGTFLLWEEADRKRFAEWLLDPEKLANEVNDDDITLVPTPDN